jgi:hypothetical protein
MFCEGIMYPMNTAAHDPRRDVDGMSIYDHLFGHSVQCTFYRMSAIRTGSMREMPLYNPSLLRNERSTALRPYTTAFPTILNLGGIHHTAVTQSFAKGDFLLRIAELPGAW